MKKIQLRKFLGKQLYIISKRYMFRSKQSTIRLKTDLKLQVKCKSYCYIMTFFRFFFVIPHHNSRYVIFCSPLLIQPCDNLRKSISRVKQKQILWRNLLPDAPTLTNRVTLRCYDVTADLTFNLASRPSVGWRHGWRIWKGRTEGWGVRVAVTTQW